MTGLKKYDYTVRKYVFKKKKKVSASFDSSKVVSMIQE